MYNGFSLIITYSAKLLLCKLYLASSCSFFCVESFLVVPSLSIHFWNMKGFNGVSHIVTAGQVHSVQVKLSE